MEKKEGKEKLVGVKKEDKELLRMEKGQRKGRIQKGTKILEKRKEGEEKLVEEGRNWRREEEKWRG